MKQNHGYILVVVYFRESPETRAAHSDPVLITMVIFCFLCISGRDEGRTLRSSSYNHGYTLFVMYFRESLEMRGSHSDLVPTIPSQRSAATSETGSDGSVSHVFFCNI